MSTFRIVCDGRASKERPDVKYLSRCKQTRPPRTASLFITVRVTLSEMTQSLAENAEDSLAGEPKVNMQVSFRDLRFPMFIRPEVPFTEQELLAFCRANKGFEIECEADGTLYVMTPAGADTSQLNVYIVVRLASWAEESGTGIAFGSDLGVRFADGSMRAPDAAWVSRERWSSLEPGQRKQFLPFCPEFVIELRSPSDRASRVEEKMERWVGKGAQLGWLIDPQRKLVMVYRPGREPETLLRPEVLDGEGPIAGFRLAMERFWA